MIAVAQRGARLDPAILLIKRGTQATNGLIPRLCRPRGAARHHRNCKNKRSHIRLQRGRAR
ncbi:hypothetical protein BOSE21B_30401 [Bosea sp. 21B]|nr:hypothetical protein BOSE7B_120512 [Bosea sp. 7B]CAD5276621.1 hypothetical protein BOSE21B_30401 [Bosea sp. 21B]